MSLRRIAPIALSLGSLALALACGEASEPAAVESGPEAAAGTGAAGGMPEPAKAEAPAAQLPSVSSCLELVKAGEFAAAIPPCTEAARQAPGNQEVADALAQARSRVSAEAAGSAQEAAEGLGETATGLGDTLP